MLVKVRRLMENMLIIKCASNALRLRTATVLIQPVSSFRKPYILVIMGVIHFC